MSVLHNRGPLAGARPLEDVGEDGSVPPDWGIAPSERDLETFEETGIRNDARVKVVLEDGRVWRGGSIGLPVPWKLRRVRRYLPLSHSE
jgi:hypothetical protein